MRPPQARPEYYPGYYATGCSILTATIFEVVKKLAPDRILFTKVGQLSAGSTPLDLVLLSRPIQNI